MTARPEAVEHAAARLAARVEAAAALAPERRFVAAIAGPPGAGKSTLAEALADALNSRAGSDCAAVFPMDGFHFDDAILHARGHRPRKGAPFTFDVDGYRATLERLRQQPHAEIAVPVFDRALELSRGSARLIGPQHRIIVTEGNYLLLDEQPWTGLAPLFDMTVFVRETEAELRARLEERWRFYKLSPAEMTEKLEANDMPNVRLVLSQSRKADAETGGATPL